MKRKDWILIKDWAGNVLFTGHCEAPEVLRIMELNKAPNDKIFVYWVDETDERNVWEYIDFSSED